MSDECRRHSLITFVALLVLGLALARPGLSAPLIWDDFPGNVIVRDAPFGSGDIDTAFATADVIVKQRMVCPRLAPSAIETRGILASHQSWDSSLTVWLTSQAPHGARLMLSHMTGLPESR